MRPKPNSAQRGVYTFSATELLWALGSLCVLHQRNFSVDMLAQEFPPESADSGHFYTESTLLQAAQRLGFKAKRIRLQAKDCAALPLPLLVHMPARAAFADRVNTGTASDPFEEATADAACSSTCLALITAANTEAIVLFQPGSNEPQTLSHSALDAQFARLDASGNRQPAHAWLFAPVPQTSHDDTDAYSAAAANEPTGTRRATGVSQAFDFRWFVPELLRHKTVWRDVLLASLALQLVTLATPLFTQAIIDRSALAGG